MLSASLRAFRATLLMRHPDRYEARQKHGRRGPDYQPAAVGYPPTRPWHDLTRHADLGTAKPAHRDPEPTSKTRIAADQDSNPRRAPLLGIPPLPLWPLPLCPGQPNNPLTSTFGG